MDDSSAAKTALTDNRPERRGAWWWPCVETGLTVYYLTGLAVLLGVFLGLDLLAAEGTRRSPRRITASDDPFLVATTRWDGQHYLEIALDGYSYEPGRRSNLAFFPLYPILLRSVYRATGVPAEWAGLLVAHVLLIAAMVLLAGYTRERYPRAPPQLAAWVVLAFGLFPTTFFMRMTYSESTFLVLALLAFWGMQRGWRPVVVAVVVGLATAARPVGVALVPPLWLYVWERSQTRKAAAESSGPHPRPLSRQRERGVAKRLGGIAWLTPIALWGLLAYMAFQYVEFGEPLAFARTQSHWRSRPDVGIGEKALALAAWEPIWSAYMPSSPGYSGRFARDVPEWADLQLANPVYFLAAAALIGLGAAQGWLSGREILLAVGLLLITYVTRGFDMCMASQGRFAAVVFPTYLVIGRLLHACPLALSGGILGLSAVYLVVYAALFAAGHCVI